MNAIERYVSASRRGDVGAATAELAADVVMFNPAEDEPVVGRDAVADALRAVDSACDKFSHLHVLVNPASETGPFALVFEAEIGDAVLRGVDLIDLDGEGKIARFEVSARPISGLIALGSRMTSLRDGGGS